MHYELDFDMYTKLDRDLQYEFIPSDSYSKQFIIRGGWDNVEEAKWSRNETRSTAGKLVHFGGQFVATLAV